MIKPYLPGRPKDAEKYESDHNNGLLEYPAQKDYSLDRIRHRITITFVPHFDESDFVLKRCHARIRPSNSAIFYFVVGQYRSFVHSDSVVTLVSTPSTVRL